MWHKIFLSENGIIREILKNMGFQIEEKESSIEDIPISGSIKNRIDELSVIETKIRLERETLSQILDYILEAFKEEKSRKCRKKRRSRPRQKRYHHPRKKLTQGLFLIP